MNWVQASGGPVKQNPLVTALASALMNRIMRPGDNSIEREKIRQDAANQREALAAAVREKEMENRMNIEKERTARSKAAMLPRVAPEVKREQELKDQWAEKSWNKAEAPLIQSEDPYYSPQTRAGIASAPLAGEVAGAAAGGMGGIAPAVTSAIPGMMKNREQPLTERAKEVASNQALMPKEWNIPGPVANLEAIRMSGENRKDATKQKGKQTIEAIHERASEARKTAGTKHKYKSDEIRLRLREQIRRDTIKEGMERERGNITAANKLKLKIADAQAELAGKPSFDRVGVNPEKMVAPYRNVKLKPYPPVKAPGLMGAPKAKPVAPVAAPKSENEEITAAHVLEMVKNKSGDVDAVRRMLDVAVRNGDFVTPEARKALEELMQGQ